jgi:hypothetical protein
MIGADARCAAHPARPSADACPVCGRARCGADAARYSAAGCAMCLADRAAHRPASSLERWVRAGLGAMLACLVGGAVATQYVDTRYFSLIAPALVGLACGAAATAASGRYGWVPLVVSALAALLGTALGFRLTIGGQNPLSNAGEVGPPYLCAVLGAAAWPIVFGPPRRRAAQGEGAGSDS